MINSEELRGQLVSYIANEISFESFEDWLIDRSWNMHKDSEQKLQEMVHEINASIFQYLDGYINEEALKRNLWTLTRDLNVELVFVPEFRGSTIQQHSSSQAPSYQVQAVGAG